MDRINISRVILGGIVAGIVCDILDYPVDGLLLGPQWAAGMKALGRPEFTLNQVMGFELVGLALGILAIWLYAAIRPRYGPGPKTAVWAGLLVWVIGVLLPNVGFMAIPHLFRYRLMGLTTLFSLVEVVVATLAGAALYKEGTGQAVKKAAAAVD